MQPTHTHTQFTSQFQNFKYTIHVSISHLFIHKFMKVNYSKTDLSFAYYLISCYPVNLVDISHISYESFTWNGYIYEPKSNDKLILFTCIIPCKIFTLIFTYLITFECPLCLLHLIHWFININQCVDSVHWNSQIKTYFFIAFPINNTNVMKKVKPFWFY